MNEQLAELISEFRRELPRRVEEIASILAQLASDLLNQDLIKHAHRLVHNLVGSCNAFGAEYVATSAKGMEVYFRDRMEEESVLTSEDIANLKHMTGLLTTLSKQWIESNAPQAYKQVKSVYKKESLVYIVEDDEAVQLALVSYLINSGYKIETFTNLNEFTQKIRDFVPCAIIMDMIFAEGDNAGAEIISELSKEIEPFPPVIFISTRGDMNARLQADKAGASRYFTKPVDEKKLIHTLDRLTNRIETHPYRVLVVDDDRLQAEYYANSLTEAGIEAKVLTEPLKVLSELASFKPDLLVSDVYMDSCSGLQLAKVIRQDDDYTNMPIVFLSSEERLDKQLVAMDLGGDDFLTKPVEPDHLVSALLARLKRARWISDIYLNLQEALNESEYRRVALDRHSIVSITDVSGTITSANEKFSEISGYSLPELIGQNHRLLNSSYHPKSFFKTMWETISSGKVWHGEICNRKKSGELYWVESTIVPFLDSNGLPYKYVSVRTDITNIKQSEEALRESKTLLQTVINNIPAGIYWIDRGGVILGCNTAFLRDMGVSKKNEILGFKWTEIAWKIREAAAFHTLDLEAMITGVASLNVEGLLSTATGFRKWIDLNRIPLRGQNGDVIGVLVAYEDVSSYKNYEHELIAARDMADAANRTKSEFLSQMSHELRTPLNAILGFSQILEMEEITQDQKEWVNEIVLAGRHLLELINDILDLAKVEAGRLTLEIGNVELWEVVLESVSLIQTQLDINHIDLEVKLGDKVLALGSEEEPPPIYLRSDRIRVKQVLLNFLSNAIKYNKKQGS
ncbi:MAG: response regulator, partial [Gammaproteobacteria bacterium]|nr:response regulator [Gammaproteobacteria bacterium]